MRELMKVCNIFELPPPTTVQVKNVLKEVINNRIKLTKQEYETITNYIQGDICKLKFAIEILCKKIETGNNSNIFNLFHTKSFNEDAKTTTRQLLENNYNINQHGTIMNETDRTIVALLWHENVIEKLKYIPSSFAYPLYYKILRNICFSDYIDRITFQQQIWQFNEMSSLIKTFYNNNIFHHYTTNYNMNPINEVRFTKVLTKYSTEYNNCLFIQELSQKLSMDKKDFISLFQEIRLCIGKDFTNDTEILTQISQIFEQYEISKLDIRRLYRYLDKSTKKETTIDDLDEDV
jgi:hypothetical protein